MSRLKSAPYSWFKVASSYLKYYIGSSGKHKVHSPFVYDFIEEIIDKVPEQRHKLIERERARLLRSKDTIEFTDYGKGGSINTRYISKIARNSLKRKKYATLLGSVAKKVNPKTILELGTSLGITTSYLSRYATESVTTMEGDASVLSYAKEVWSNLNLQNINPILGDFDKTLGQLGTQSFDLIYIDGNHKCAPTLSYFDTLLKHNSHEETVFIFDDIHYSKEMEQAWESIKNHPKVYTTLDLFFLGFVYIDSSRVKQDFVLRY